MQRLIPSGKCLAVCVLLAGVACESPPSGVVPAPAAAPASTPLPLGIFSAERAFADVAALAQRSAPAGEESNRALRDYVTSQLGPTGLAVETLETPESRAVAEGTGEARSWKHVTATVSGASPDLFLLVARLGGAGRVGSSAEQVREDVSGAALLLELARVLSTRSLPYTTRLIWLGGDALEGPAPDAGTTAQPRGSGALVAQMAERGELSRIRLLVAFDRVCREDLRIARDLRSHRAYREEFFDAAARIGRLQVFPRNQDYESVEGGHQAFSSAGVRAVVALAAADSPPLESRSCVAQSLEAVGAVSLEALDAIGRRLAKIDRFSRAPLASAREDVAPPAVPAADSQSAAPSAAPANP